MIYSMFLCNFCPVLRDFGSRACLYINFYPLKTGLGSWPNIDQAPAPELTIFKSMAPAPAPELVFRFMWSQLQSSFQGFTNVVKCNIFLAMDFTDDNIIKW